jgi:hypothetical protein
MSWFDQVIDERHKVDNVEITWSYASLIDSARPMLVQVMDGIEDSTCNGRALQALSDLGTPRRVFNGGGCMRQT